MIRLKSAAIVLISVSTLATQAAELDTLTQQIQLADKNLFDAVFETCNADVLAKLISDDFEFYHDKGGQVAHSKGEFVDRIRGSCVNQAAGTENRTRRQLDPASLEVFPIASSGAVETGSHRFFHRRENAPDIPTEHARFTMLWRKVGGVWLLARVMSYDHKPIATATNAN